ncbi:restriction endonuclease subunit S [Clostridium perfringens]|uniref:restriction endonuclease subunit S n=1 Tax=Clostridium perfringens TaxID=1502 RepID=UPI001459A498|nr:restriction endonuclease subunit S [Clostridium perfringens]ELC8449113.1 restriction endonuclease subunit S [Clostridium perfringens]MDK0812981.1 restriction endonuclease subunit S [Clostridium perfringens]MDV5111726.1 restriction endonuclease subunit S [Clostridium perfringens]NMF19706.1 restriction endonuclease subunit S [Clostridium perfringens]
MSFKETEVGRIPIDWEVDELSNKVDLVMGQSPKSEFYNDKGIGMPFMQGRTTFGEKYHYINTWCTDIKRVGIKNSVLMSVRAPVGDVNIATEDICIGRGLASLNMKNKNNEFLYYLLKNYSGLLISKESGTVFGSINKAGIEKLVLPFPSKSEQKAIAKILSDLDEKIEINNKINKNLEEMAQTIFKQWFVDFEFPNEEGKPYKSSGGEMVESELGMIPKTFSISTLGNEVKTIDNRGKTPPLEKEKTEYPIIDVKVLAGSSRIINYNNCLKFVNEETYKNWFRSGHPLEKDILISTVGSLAELKMFFGHKGCIAQNVVALRSINISSFYMYEYLKYIKPKLVSYNIGSVQPSIKITHIMKHNIIIPEKNIVLKYDNLINSIIEKIYNNENENERLEKLRDTLLPKLMSGEIRVPLENSEN